jgi:hypothetical protein
MDRYGKLEGPRSYYCRKHYELFGSGEVIECKNLRGGRHGPLVIWPISDAGSDKRKRYVGTGRWG